MAHVCDVVVIGAGIAGASVGYELARYRSVVVLERELQPGYHSSGRSGAVFTEAYGTPLGRALGAASREFYAHPPAGFSEYPLLIPRGCLYTVRPESLDRMNAEFSTLKAHLPSLEHLDGKVAQRMVPVMQGRRLAAALWEPGAMDMDVHSILTGYLRNLAARNGTVIKDAEVTGLGRASGAWVVETRQGEFRADIVVNAAGAWADRIGEMAGAGRIGLVPKRRTVVLFEPPEGVAPAEWPVVIDFEEKYYFKPDAGKILASPADETPVTPCDVQPEEFDIAIAADLIGRYTTMSVDRISHRWAGLRSFVADKSPVAGFDPRLEGFFWLAGQGGVGIITAAALARCSAGLILNESIPADLQDRDISKRALSPLRIQETHDERRSSVKQEAGDAI